MKSNSYRDLEVWKKAVDLAKIIYEVTNGFPDKTAFTLMHQLRRSAISLPSNIAEGQARRSAKEFRYFLNITLGSIAELETQIIIAKEVNLITEAIQDNLLHKTDEITRMVKGLLNHLKHK